MADVLGEVTRTPQQQHYARQNAIYALEARRSLGALVGIAQGLLGDQHLADSEIRFLHDWLTKNEAIRYEWPGDVIYSRIQTVLADGVITEAERTHLVATLEDLMGSGSADAAECARTTGLAFDVIDGVEFAGATFCLTGEFVYAPKEICGRAIECRGGIVKTSVTKKLRYLVVGGRGSEAWKHGSFGTKIERAMALKREGATLFVVDEKTWTAGLNQALVIA